MNEVLRQSKYIWEAFIFDSSTISLLLSQSYTQYTILTVDEVRGRLRENSTLFCSSCKCILSRKLTLNIDYYWLERGKTLNIMLQHIESDFLGMKFNHQRVRFSSRFLLHTETNYHRYINETLLSCFVFEPEREIISAAGWLFSGTSERITKTHQKEKRSENEEQTKNRFVSVHPSTFHVTMGFIIYQFVKLGSREEWSKQWIVGVRVESRQDQQQVVDGKKRNFSNFFQIALKSSAFFLGLLAIVVCDI